MAKFFGISNLMSRDLGECVPWEFKPKSIITPQIRGDKQERQLWYSNPSTEHQFYTGIEPHNPTQRCSKENPARMLHAVSADYDTEFTDERLDEFVAACKIKPAYIETSLGGNRRLVWLLPFPVAVDSNDYCTYLLQRMKSWLMLDKLPLLDEKAWEDPCRTLCNGCAWRATGHGAIDENTLQAFLVAAARKYRFESTDLVEIPLDVVEKELRKKYPDMTWPSEFVVESQGPSFWIPESKSTMSAIVKPSGMISFSQNATKFHTPWSELLGKEFVKQFADNAIAQATRNIYWDTINYWKEEKDEFRHFKEKELVLFFKVDCRLSTKPGKEGVSQVDIALRHIQTNNRVDYAAPFMFQRRGLINYQTRKVLNTYYRKAIEPAAGHKVFTDCPLIHAVTYNMFHNIEGEWQLDHYNAWWKFYFTCAFELKIQPGANMIVIGRNKQGKTFINRFGVGVMVGGFTDCSDFLVEGNQFNSHLFTYPHWCLDDDASKPGGNEKFQTAFKKMVGNQDHLFHQKYMVPGLVTRPTRVGVTMNPDFDSSKLLGPMTNEVLDKTYMLRCKDIPFQFPEWDACARQMALELPIYARALLDWNPPSHIKLDERYGYRTYQHPSMLEHVYQGSPSATFKELLYQFLKAYFIENKDAKAWTGTVTQLHRAMGAGDNSIRDFRLPQVNGFLLNLKKENLVRCESETTGDWKLRTWSFFRFETTEPPLPTLPTVQLT